ncbi:Holliday junction resolvase-like protein [Bradyrhizobium erythrophlei]|uniref:Endonuclease related to Holliday junction resolvase n=1 Tax=Bradyrhizobium erythrophlei TaxID=1437360 RepID=A0A1M5KTR1_9BRAD|nr:Holliday junction resolvase-like protein [Bradyrhizobium erythrophlei]SHG56158.1 Endonuclease related to Holliday junction resolvase [Bradyrhizobium erythrophlei]
MPSKKPTQTLIAELKRNKRFMGTCPTCGDDFRLADAALFALDEKPPDAALAAIAAMRERIKERRTDLAKARERMTARAEKTAHAVNLGKIIEKILPSFSSFPHSAGDCRALFEPIDYLIFSGLAARGQVESLLFVDVKSGKARLTGTQRNIKERVEAGAVKFDTHS